MTELNAEHTMISAQIWKKDKDVEIVGPRKASSIIGIATAKGVQRVAISYFRAIARMFLSRLNVQKESVILVQIIVPI